MPVAPSALIVREDFERSLVALGVPDFIENSGRELPLVIQDKIFQDDSQDPSYPGITATGSFVVSVPLCRALGGGRG